MWDVKLLDFRSIKITQKATLILNFCMVRAFKLRACILILNFILDVFSLLSKEQDYLKPFFLSCIPFAQSIFIDPRSKEDILT